MTVEAILTEFNQRGIALRVEGEKLIAKPLAAVPPHLREVARRCKAELVAQLRAEQARAAAARMADQNEDEIDRLAAADGWKPPPEIPGGVVSEIRRIEAEALTLGWDHGRLWRFQFWPHRQAEPRGLASVMNEGDKIGEVTPDYIVIIKTKRSILRFQRSAS